MLHKALAVCFAALAILLLFSAFVDMFGDAKLVLIKCALALILAHQADDAARLP